MIIKMNRYIQKNSIKHMWIAGVFTLLGIYLHHFSNFPQFAYLPFIVGTILAGYPILFRAYTSLKYKLVSIEVLVSIAVLGAFIIGEFSEGAVVTFLFQFGSYLEQKTMKKTRSAIKELTQMAPVTAWKIEDEAIEEIDVDEVEIDDVLLVKTGDQVPVDGIVIEGESYINEASITGESVPKKKQPGDVVYAGTLADSGTIKMKATKVGEDTTFAKIIALVEQAQDSKSPAERFIDKFARYYTPCVVLIAALVFLFLRNLDTAITVLVLACPGALVIGAPIANVAGIGRGAKEGILLKGGDSIHTFAKSDLFAFDKTGSLTIGHPVVEQCLCLNDERKLISYACALEQASSHPLAKSILDYASQKEIAIHPIELVETIKGKGLKGTIDNHPVLIGSLRFLKENNIAISNEFQTLLDNHKDPSASYVYMSVDDKLELTFLIKDSIKEDGKDCLAKLKKLGIKECVMLTGDNEVVAKSVANQIGIDTTYHELLPEDKLSIIKNLQSQNHIVTFVGDGINDSPALMGSDIGIAMGSGTDVAIESSDVVLIKSNLESITKALMISKKTVRILYENIFIAIGTVLFLLIGLFAGYIHMGIGMLIHEASILVVIFNATRLLVWRKNK